MAPIRALLDLPAEIRNKVYGIVFSGIVAGIQVDGNKFKLKITAHVSQENRSHLRLFSTCKQITQEAFPVLSTALLLEVSILATYDLVTASNERYSCLTSFNLETLQTDPGVPLVLRNAMPFVQHMRIISYTYPAACHGFAALPKLQTLRLKDTNGAVYQNQSDSPHIDHRLLHNSGDIDAMIVAEAMKRIDESRATFLRDILIDTDRRYRVLYELRAEFAEHFCAPSNASCFSQVQQQMEVEQDCETPDMYFTLDLDADPPVLMEKKLHWSSNYYETYEALLDDVTRIEEVRRQSGQDAVA